MEITDHAYITRMRDAALQPALTALEAAMLPANLPRRTGALSYVKTREAEFWRFGRLGAEGITCRRSESGIRDPVR